MIVCFGFWEMNGTRKLFHFFTFYVTILESALVSQTFVKLWPGWISGWPGEVKKLPL